MNYLMSCFVFTFIGLTFAQTCNRVNEVYTDCGTACPETCANMNEQGRACITVCRSGCFCKPGYVRNNKGICVLKRECPRSIQEGCADNNEEYNECGSACPETCANMNKGGRVCIAMCVSGCFCKPGLVRGSNGKCVPKRKCLQGSYREERCADPKEQYNTCGTACPLTCQNFRSAHLAGACIEICKPGCFCRAPYVRNKLTGRCVLKRDCPQTFF